MLPFSKGSRGNQLELFVDLLADNNKLGVAGLGAALCKRVKTQQ